VEGGGGGRGGGGERGGGGGEGGGVEEAGGVVRGPLLSVPRGEIKPQAGKEATPAGAARRRGHQRAEACGRVGRWLAAQSDHARPAAPGARHARSGPQRPPGGAGQKAQRPAADSPQPTSA